MVLVSAEVVIGSGVIKTMAHVEQSSSMTDEVPDELQFNCCGVIESSCDRSGASAVGLWT